MASRTSPHHSTTCPAQSVAPGPLQHPTGRSTREWGTPQWVDGTKLSQCGGKASKRKCFSEDVLSAAQAGTGWRCGWQWDGPPLPAW